MSDLGIGDADQPYLDVQPADVTTTVTLTATRPDGSIITVPVTPGPLETVPGTSPVVQRQRWTADPITYSQAGKWVLRWVVSGTGFGAEDLEVWIQAAPVAGGPVWSPGLSHVAVYVPRLTVDETTPSPAELGTFNGATNPNATVAQQHINDAVAGVIAACPTIPVGLEPLARAAAALRAAASIQRAYAALAPGSGSDVLAVANALDARADAELARLLAAVDDLEAEEEDLLVLPVWQFPAPDLRFDDARYF